MEDEPHEIWFYSSDGEKRGPVSFTHLQAKAKDASLNPRLDMVWTKGMDDWKLAGDIKGLFKRHAALKPPEIPTPALAVDDYQSPPGESVEDQMVKQGEWPGARRRSYLIATLVFPLIWGLALAAGARFLTTQFGPEIMNFAMTGLTLVPLLVIIFISLKRLVNLGMSRWWVFGILVPFLNLWVGYRCFACPGGYAYHKKLDSAGVFLTIVYWLMLLLALATIIGIITALNGSWGTSEMRQQIQEIIRAATSRKP